MKRFGIATLAVMLLSAMASAHFVFLVPDGSDSGVKAVFSDSLKPDANVSIEKIQNTKLILIDATGKESVLPWTLDKVGAFYKIDVSGNGIRMLLGTTDYGVLQRGDRKPFWLKYHSKAILGEIPSADKAKAGDRAPLEIVPVVEGGKIRFLAVIGGKPAVKTEISVMVPSEEKPQDLTTDEKGRTPAFEKAGLYGVRIRLVEAKTGELKGKKYEEFRNYATLVVNFAPAK